MRHGRSSPTIRGGGPGRSRRPASILRGPVATGSPASSAPHCHQARHRPWRRPGRTCVASPTSTVSRLILQRTAIILGPAREGRKRQGQVGDSGPHGGAEAGGAGIFCFLSADRRTALESAICVGFAAAAVLRPPFGTTSWKTTAKEAHEVVPNGPLVTVSLF
jgi:hypothetical protein